MFNIPYHKLFRLDEGQGQGVGEEQVAWSFKTWREAGGSSMFVSHPALA